MTGPIAPLFSIWVEPRQTIRDIVSDDPARSVIGLAMVGGALQRLELAWFRALSHPGSAGAYFPIRVVIGVAVGAFFGVIGIYFGAWLVRVPCRILGGVAALAEMRAALAWSSVPGITAASASILLVLFGVLSPPEFKHGRVPVMTGSTVELGLLNFALTLWGFIVQMKCIGEVNRFSAWRAFAAVVLLVGSLAVLVVVIVLVAGGMSH